MTEGCKLFFGNVSFEVEEDDLREHVETKAGCTVNEVVIVKDRETGKSRGFAFVTFQNAEDAKAAKAQLNDSEFKGRNMNVNDANPRSESSGGGRSGGYGGGRGGGGGFRGGRGRGGFRGGRGGGGGGGGRYGGGGYNQGGGYNAGGRYGGGGGSGYNQGGYGGGGGGGYGGYGNGGGPGSYGPGGYGGGGGGGYDQNYGQQQNYGY